MYLNTPILPLLTSEINSDLLYTAANSCLHDNLVYIGTNTIIYCPLYFCLGVLFFFCAVMLIFLAESSQSRMQTCIDPSLLTKGKEKENSTDEAQVPINLAAIYIKDKSVFIHDINQPSGEKLYYLFPPDKTSHISSITGVITGVILEGQTSHWPCFGVAVEVNRAGLEYASNKYGRTLTKNHYLIEVGPVYARLSEDTRVVVSY